MLQWVRTFYVDSLIIIVIDGPLKERSTLARIQSFGNAKWMRNILEFVFHRFLGHGRAGTISKASFILLPSGACVHSGESAMIENDC